ncbi:MAG: hypothetical protein ACAI44_14630, partial [Candidatus Sericytochromatia bacterium]
MLTFLTMAACSPDFLDKLVPGGSKPESAPPDGPSPSLKDPLTDTTPFPQASSSSDTGKTPVLLPSSLASLSPATIGFVAGSNVKVWQPIDDVLEASAPGPISSKRRYTLYFGHDVTDAELYLHFNKNQPAETNLQIYSGKGEVLATLDANTFDDPTAPAALTIQSIVPGSTGIQTGTGTNRPGDLTTLLINTKVYIPGNIAYLYATDTSSVPTFTVEKFRTNTVNGTLPMPVPPTLDILATAFTPGSPQALPLNRQPSLPVTLNSPILLYSQTDKPSTYFMTVNGVGSKRVEIIMNGTGDVIVSDPVRGFLLPGSDLGLATVHTGVVVNSVTINPVQPARDTLLLTVTVQPQGLNGKLAK